jgi:hypothetical protein
MARSDYLDLLCGVKINRQDLVATRVLPHSLRVDCIAGQIPKHSCGTSDPIFSWSQAGKGKFVDTTGRCLLYWRDLVRLGIRRGAKKKQTQQRPPYKAAAASLINNPKSLPEAGHPHSCSSRKTYNLRLTTYLCARIASSRASKLSSPSLDNSLRCTGNAASTASTHPNNFWMFSLVFW